MSEQRALRKRIATLEHQQVLRIERTAERKKMLDETIEKADREIANLKQQLTIGVVQ
jgi:hypothetical protein